MKRFLPFIAAVLFASAANAQITITAADMPVHGDMLSYSNASMTGINFHPGDSGANHMWNYNLVPISMSIDTYKHASEINAAYASTISLSAIGYKVADSIPGLSMIPNTPIPISITDVYTYFEQINTPRPAFVASAFSYTLINILPTAANYTDPDVWYFFPLAYGNHTDSTHYALNISLMSFAAIHEVGYRKTRVDGWGQITTPLFTTPVNCIRVRSETIEIDSVAFSGSTFGTPRHTVEYKWLVNGQHYPALWITSTVINDTERITTVKYRDTVATPIPPNSIVSSKPGIYEITAFPNPATGNTVTLNLPADWKNYEVEMFDITSRQVAALHNERTINVSALPAGQYLVRITSGNNTGYARITK